MPSRAVRRAMALVLGCVAGACCSCAIRENWPVITPAVGFSPYDGATAASGPLGLVLSESPGPDSDVKKLAAALRLWTYPEMIQVLASAAIHGEGTIPWVELVPQERLGDRWYALGVESPMQGFKSSQPLGQGWGVRFRTGSDPQLRALSLCNIAGDPYYLHVSFSERLVGTAYTTILVHLSQQGQPMRCTAEPESISSTGALAVTLACPGMSAARSTDVAITPGFFSPASMKPLDGGNPIQNRFDPAPPEETCRHYLAPVRM